MKSKMVFVFFLFLTLVGCGNEQEQEQANNHVKIRTIKDVETLNPVTYGGMIESRLVFNFIYQSLLTIDTEDIRIKPVLAVDLPRVEVLDSISYFFYSLRKEAKWANQTPVTANDVIFSLKVANCPGVNNDSRRMTLDFIQDMQIDSSSLKNFILQCNGYAEDMVIMTGGFEILPEYIYDPEGILKNYDLRALKENYESLKEDENIQAFAKQFNTLSSSRQPDAYIGSGGYELAAWQSDQFITLEKKPAWWAEDLNLSYITAKPEKITFQIIPDDGAAVLALKNHQLDVMGDIPTNEFQKLAKDSSFLKQFNLFTPPTFTVNYIGINSRKPKFQSKMTRQALAHLVNVEGIIQSVGQTLSSRANSLIGPLDKRNYNDQIEPYEFETEKATNMLFEDGWKKENGGWYKTINGKKEQLSGNVQYKAGKYEYEYIALIFKQTAEKMGIPITITPLENSVLSGNLRQHNFDFYVRGLVGNPFAFNFTPILHTQSAALNGMNYTAFGTAESDSLIEAIISNKDKEEQSKQIKAFQEILHEEATLIFLYFNEQKLAIHNKFENLKISSFYPNYDASAFELKK